MATITIPHNFTPREYQRPLYNCLNTGKNRGIAVWHRRAGKDKVFINIMAREAFKRVGSYFYILPYYVQARRIIWEGLDKDGFRNLGHFPDALIKRKDNQQMTLELQNGSFVRFLGSDNIDSIVGTNPVGVVFSEFSLHKIDAWNYLRPILLENEGWALFNGTPRGKNHMWKMLNAAKQSPDWFYDVRTIDDTQVMTAQQVAEEVRNGMPQALALQEFYCSFDAAMVGAYYADQMDLMAKENRIAYVPHEPATLVNTAWDLGVDDSTVIWFFQQVGKEIRMIDIVASEGHGLDWYVQQMQQRPYTYGYHVLPHDVRVRELGTGKSRLGVLHDLGLKDVRVAKRPSIEDGIQATRNILARVWMDETKCAKGIEAMKQYRASWDPNKECYGAPIHDWSSHYADAFRVLGISFMEQPDSVMRQVQAEGYDYNPIRLREPMYHHGQRPEYTDPDLQSVWVM